MIKVFQEKIKNIVLFILILSILQSIYSFKKIWQTRNWISTTAIVTDITLPDGDILGTYTDENNIIHSNVPLYTDFSYQGHRKDASLIIGKTVKIIYNPINKKTDKNYRFYYYLSIIISILLSCIYRKITKNCKL